MSSPSEQYARVAGAVERIVLHDFAQRELSARMAIRQAALWLRDFRGGEESALALRTLADEIGGPRGTVVRLVRELGA